MNTILWRMCTALVLFFIQFSGGAQIIIPPNLCQFFYEPNDIVAQAKAIPVSGSINAAIRISLDNDYYKVYVPQRGLLTVSLTNLPANYNLQVKDSTAIFWSGSYNPGIANEIVELNALSAGTYYIRVYGVQGVYSTSCYRLTTTFAPLQCVDVFEPNNNLASAAAISVNTNHTAKISGPLDSDWYKITTSLSAPNLRVRLTNLPVNYNLYLYNSVGGLLGSSTNAGLVSETITRNTGIPQTYYIRVSSAILGSSSSSCYILRASTSSLPYIIFPLLPVDVDSSDFEARAAVEPFDNSETDGSMPGLVISPNPVKAGSQLFVQFSGEQQGTLKLTDMSGKTILDQVINPGETKIDLTGIQPGIYVLDGGTGIVSRIVIE